MHTNLARRVVLTLAWMAAAAAARPALADGEPTDDEKQFDLIGWATSAPPPASRG